MIELTEEVKLALSALGIVEGYLSEGDTGDALNRFKEDWAYITSQSEWLATVVPTPPYEADWTYSLLKESGMLGTLNKVVISLVKKEQN